MTEQNIIKKAMARAKKVKEDIWVVNDCGDYATATEYELDTFYFGCRPIWWTDGNEVETC